MRKAALLGLFLLLAGIAAGWAQNLDINSAPKYLWIESDTMKPDGNHEAYTKFLKSFKEAMGQSDLYWLAEYPIAGRGNEINFIGYINSGAELEKAFQQENKIGMELAKKDPGLFAQANSAIVGSETMLAKFEPDLSMNADKVDHSKLTRARIMTYQVRPGGAPEFVALIKEMNAVSTKAGDTSASLVYSIVAGDGFPGYIFVTPMASLAELDKTNSPEVQAAFTPLVRQHMMDVVKNTVVKRTSTIYVIEPTLSRPPQSYIAANPDFWQVKEEPVAATAPTKKVKKEKPAALKEKQ